MAAKPDQTLALVTTLPNQDAIALLEQAVSRAQNGTTRAVAIVEVTTDSVNFEISNAERSYHFMHSGAQRLAAHLASLADD